MQVLRTDYAAGAPVPGFSGIRVAQSLVFCAVFCQPLFDLLYLVIVIIVIRFAASD